MGMFAEEHPESVKPGLLDYSLKKKKKKTQTLELFQRKTKHIIKEMESRN